MAKLPPIHLAVNNAPSSPASTDNTSSTIPSARTVSASSTNAARSGNTRPSWTSPRPAAEPSERRPWGERRPAAPPLEPAHVELAPNPFATNASPALVDVALYHAGRGRRVAALGPVTLESVEHGSTIDPKAIARIWRQHPDSLVGLVTGTASRVFAMEVLPKRSTDGVDAAATLRALEELHEPLPPTWTQQTRDGGRLLFFAWSPEHPLAGDGRRLGGGLALHAEGGRVVVDPHCNEDGEPLPITLEHHGEPAPAPVWLLDYLMAKLTPKPAAAEPSPFAALAQQLVENGYAPLPIAPRSKAPGTVDRRGKPFGLKDWSRFCDEPAREWQIEKWARADGLGIGVACGFGGLLALDLDTDDPAILSAIMKAIPHSDFAKKGAKGETLFFVAAEAIQSEAINLPTGELDVSGRPKTTRVVDILSHGRQTVLPHSIHPNTGQPYVWSRGRGLDEVDVSDLPALTAADLAALKAALAPFGFEPPAPVWERVDVQAGGGDGPAAEINTWALANLGAWVPALGLARCRGEGRTYKAVAEWRPSNTGRPLAERALNLSIAPNGIVDFGDGGGCVSLPDGDVVRDGRYTPLNLILSARGGSLADAMSWLQERRDGPSRPMDVTGLVAQHERRRAAEIQEPPAVRQAEDAQDATSEESEALEDGRTISPAQHARDVLAAPGLLGETARFVRSTMLTPTAAGALGSALVTLGTVLGRKVASPTECATHLYVALTLPSGGGKDKPLKAADALLDAVNMRDSCPYGSGSDFKSETAIKEFVLNRPVSLVTIDELGRYLQGLNSRNASSQEVSISSLLRKLYAVDAGSKFKFPQRAADAHSPPVVTSPAMSIFGVSNAPEFFDALSGREVVNGFLNRFVYFKEEKVASPITPSASLLDLPSDLVRSLTSLGRWHNTPRDMMFYNNMTMRDAQPSLRKVPFGAGAEAVYTEFRAAMSARCTAEADFGDLFRRTAENAVRIATIAAASEQAAHGPFDADDRHPPEATWSRAEISRDTMEWATRIALYSSESLLIDVRTHLAEELRFAQLQTAVENALDKAGRAGVTRDKLMRALKRRVGRFEQIKGVLDMLKESRDIVELKRPSGNGKDLHTYWTARYAPSSAR